MTYTKTSNSLISNKPRRIWELDFLRGLCVLLMIWDHFMYDCAVMFAPIWADADISALIGLSDFATQYMEGELRRIFHPIIFNMFFVICGISCSFSRNNFKRGTQVLIVAFLITLVTTIIETPITFGVLHMLGFAIIIWAIIDIICRHNKYATAIACLIVGLLITCMDYIILAAGGVEPNEDLFWLSFQFGGPYNSTDYFPLIPNVGAMLLGAACGTVLYRKRRSLLPCLDKFGWYKPIGIWGRVALWVYVLHQVVVMAILGIVTYALTGVLIFS